MSQVGSSSSSSGLLSDATFTDLGGSISSLFSGMGELAAASAYTQASQLNQSNAAISQASGQLNAQLATRNAYQTMSTTQASTEATGFTLSGSAGDILREQAQQGALAKSVALSQGELQSQSFAAQAAAEQGQAASAKMSGGGGILGGLLKGLGAVASIL